MVKIAFCDDDIAVVRQIAALLNKYRETRDQPMECHAFESSLELLAAMEQGLRPDVLLLDVIMPGENGISAAREIREYDRNVKIIFLTSSAEYAVQSYTVDAYYYQLKPIREETFFQVLDSVLDECCRSAENSVMLRCKSGIVRVRLEKLMYCEVVGRTLLLHLDNGQVLESAGGLDKLAAELTGLTVGTLNRHVARGNIFGAVVGRKVLISKQSLIGYLATPDGVRKVTTVQMKKLLAGYKRASKQ